MRKYYSEAFEALHEEYLADFELGFISEAELREFEADAFIDENDNEAADDNVYRGKSAFKETVEASSKE